MPPIGRLYAASLKVELGHAMPKRLAHVGDSTLDSSIRSVDVFPILFLE